MKVFSSTTHCDLREGKKNECYDNIILAFIWNSNLGSTVEAVEIL